MELHRFVDWLPAITVLVDLRRLVVGVPRPDVLQQRGQHPARCKQEQARQLARRSFAVDCLICDHQRPIM
jgi:hypothetical protein